MKILGTIAESLNGGCEMPTIQKVPEFLSDLCPYCFYLHDPTEGTSEMHIDGTCYIWCHICGRRYYYRTIPKKKKWRM